MPISLDVIREGLPRIGAEIGVQSPHYTFLTQKVFGGMPIPGSPTNGIIEVDYSIYGTSAEAVESILGADANVVRNDGKFKAALLKPAYYDDKSQLNFNGVAFRALYEGYDFKDKPYEFRAAYALGILRNGIIQMHDNAIEKNAAAALLKGKVTTKDGEQSMITDSSLLALSGSKLYTDWLGTLAQAGAKIAKKGGRLPKVLLMNQADALNLATVLGSGGFLDAHSWNVAKIYFDEYDGDGVTHHFDLLVPGIGSISIVSYLGSDGTGEDFIPQGSAVLLPDAPIGAMGYGLILGPSETGPALPSVQRRLVSVFPEGAENDPHHALWVEVQSSALPIVTHLFNYGVITGIPKTIS